MFWVSLSSAPLGSRSPPHPSRLRRATFPPRRRLWAEDPTTFSSRYQPPPPSPPSRGAGRYGRRFSVCKKKKSPPSPVSKTREGGSREEETPPPWCSFLHFSQEKWRPPAGTPPGRCAPRWVRAPTARRVRTTGGLAPRPHAAGLPCAKADGTTCLPPPQKDKDRLSPVFASPLGNWKQEKDMVSSPRRGRAVAGKRRPSPGPSGPGRGAPGGGGRSP
jgi:hypothetical protein